MSQFELNEEEKSAVRDILGYLNFSSGPAQPRFFSAWNCLFEGLSRRGVSTVWSASLEVLRTELAKLSEQGEAFRRSERAAELLDLMEKKLLPEYRRFHQDLLFHQTDEFLFNPFFLARLCQIMATRELSSLLPEEISEVISEANDFLGYRPIPALEGEEKHEPNPHEWVGAVPLYLKGVGVVCGRYHDLIAKTLEILRSTDPVLLHDAWFDPDKLDELAVDPRAFDFDHPVNRRPNYHFGTWDPHEIDENGYYRRFIIHQVTLDGILRRVEDLPRTVPNDFSITISSDAGGTETVSRNAPVPAEELLYEAAAVLAGTMLMGSGITGDHVQAHDSNVTLSTLMPQIASYRDRFYELLIQKAPETMRPRLEEESKRLFQPFGSARQDLNKRLAKCRADQLQRLHLARLFARMGYFDAAERQTKIVSVASARIFCRIDCFITQAYTLAESGRAGEAVELLDKLEGLLHRGIDCGALPDPWSLLGFGAQYNLFPSTDNTVHDHRVDDLINLLNDIFDLYGRLLKEAAASGNSDLQADLSDRMSDLAGWWDQFGSTEVSSVEGFSGQAVWESAAKVATALAVWHKAGTAAGDVAFWSRHVERFDSPKAFVLLGEALLDKKDPVASMSLLMHWLGHSDEIPLIEGDYSFHALAFRWMEDLWEDGRVGIGRSSGRSSVGKGPASRLTPDDYLRRWRLTREFLDKLAKNADFYWSVPKLDVNDALFDSSHSEFDEDDDEDEEYDDEDFETNEEARQAAVQLWESVFEKKQFSGLTVRDIVCSGQWTSPLLTDSAFQEFLDTKLDPAGMDKLVSSVKKRFFRAVSEQQAAQQTESDDVPTDEIALYLRFLDQIMPKKPSGNSSALFGKSAALFHYFNQENILPGYLRAYFHIFDLREIVSLFFTKRQNTEFNDLISEYGKDSLKLFLSTLFSTNTSDTQKPRQPNPWGENPKNDSDEDDADDDSNDDDSNDDDSNDDDSNDDDSDADEYNDAFDGNEFDDEQFDGIEFDGEFGDALFDNNPADEEPVGIDPTFQAAYDDMVFRDSANDGIDDDLADSFSMSSEISELADELADETDRVNDRLAFIFSLMKLWKYAAGKSPLLSGGTVSDEERAETEQFCGKWLKKALNCRHKLSRLLSAAHSLNVPSPRGTSESLMEYDQFHGTKEILLDRIIRTAVEVEDAILFLGAALGGPQRKGLLPFEELVSRVFAAIFHSDVRTVKKLWSALLGQLESKTLLYIPTSRGGDPQAIVLCRYVQQVVLRLLEYAPRLGLLSETFRLLACVQKMERIRPPQPGAITEFDRIFETATRSVTEEIIESSRHWRVKGRGSVFTGGDEALIYYLERMMEILLACWLSHSQHIRISSVEGILSAGNWNEVKSFIQKYGSDIFTQQFLSFRNLRAILHQGVENYLGSLLKIYSQERDLESAELLVDDLAHGRMPLPVAVNCLETIFECIAENYSEYVDYNSTTTHSDHGEKLYMLLDMLRVLTQYERVAWNLKPVYWVHQSMIRAGRLSAGALWENSIGRKSIAVSEENIQNYNKLSSRYGVWLPSIYERLAERFVRPLQIDRMCGLVPKAIRQARPAGESSDSAATEGGAAGDLLSTAEKKAFDELEEQVEYFASQQTGIGFETPEWLSELEDEVADVQDNEREVAPENREDAFNPGPVFEPIPLTRAELERNIAWSLEHISFQEPED